MIDNKESLTLSKGNLQHIAASLPRRFCELAESVRQTESFRVLNRA